MLHLYQGSLKALPKQHENIPKDLNWYFYQKVKVVFSLSVFVPECVLVALEVNLKKWLCIYTNILNSVNNEQLFTLCKNFARISLNFFKYLIKFDVAL